jgi:PKD repeat protein
MLTKNIKSTILLFAILLTSIHPSIATTKRALFIGNSLFSGAHIAQTHVKDFTKAAGDTLVQTLAIHTGVGIQEYWYDYSSLTLPATAFTTNIVNGIRQGNLDYVVMNEASIGFIEADATILANTYHFANQFEYEIKRYNPGAETMYYMTWGMEAGYYQLNYLNQGFTTSTMSKKVEAGYVEMARQNDATNAPIGVVLRLMYEKAPYNGTRVLYTDGKHPSEIAAYAAAATLYTSMFRKDPTLVNYMPTDFRDTCIAKGLVPATIAADILQLVKDVVLTPDSLAKWKIGTYDPVAAYDANVQAGNVVAFTNNSARGVTYSWDFGDGTKSTAENPVHTYASTGTYTVKLTVTGYARFTNEITQSVNTANLSPLSVNTVVSTNELTGFTYKESKGPSEVQSFAVSGSNLTDNITVTAPANFEISLSADANFTTSTLVLSRDVNNSATPTTIYVRLAAGKTESLYYSSLSVTTAGTSNKYIGLGGQVTANNPMFSTANLIGFNYKAGAGPSPVQTMHVNGAELTGDIILTASTNFEIATTQNGVFQNTISLNQSAGNVSLTPIYVRLKANLPVGNYSEILTLRSQSANNIDVQLKGNVDISTTEATNPISDVHIAVVDGKIKVSGAKLGSKLNVYTTDGKLIHKFSINAENTDFSIGQKGIIFVQISE